MLIDFHIHSTFSDGKLTIPEVVDLYGPRGFRAIAITDHLCEEQTFLGKASHFLGKSLTKENFNQYLDVINEEAKRALDQYGMLVIPGVELTKNSLLFNRSAHLLGIGISKYISADGDVLDLVKRIKDQGALSIAAHPVSTQELEAQTYHLWKRREELALHIDAWEVASGRHLFKKVLKSGLPLIANSDLHHPFQINSWKTKLSCEVKKEAIFKAIKKQEVDFKFFEDISYNRPRTKENQQDFSSHLIGGLHGSL